MTVSSFYGVQVQNIPSILWVCSGKPSSLQEAYDKAIAAKADPDVLVSENRIVVYRISDGTIFEDGLATHWALSLNGLFFAHKLSQPIRLTQGYLFDLMQFDIEIPSEGISKSSIVGVDVRNDVDYGFEPCQYCGSSRESEMYEGTCGACGATLIEKLPAWWNRKTRRSQKSVSKRI